MNSEKAVIEERILTPQLTPALTPRSTSQRWTLPTPKPTSQSDLQRFVLPPFDPQASDPFVVLAEDWFSKVGFDWHPTAALRQ